MKDIDRNINSHLYTLSKIIHINAIASNITDNFTNVFSVNVNGNGAWTVELQPGEYYYRHVLYSVESDNFNYYVEIHGQSSAYPIYSYYAQSPLTRGTGNDYIAIPYHFVVDEPLIIGITASNINGENSKIKSVIQIKKRVK